MSDYPELFGPDVSPPVAYPGVPPLPVDSWTEGKDEDADFLRELAARAPLERKAVRDRLRKIAERLDNEGRTAMDDCSECGGALDVIGTHRTSDGHGGMKHTKPADCIKHLKARR